MSLLINFDNLFDFTSIQYFNSRHSSFVSVGVVLVFDSLNNGSLLIHDGIGLGIHVFNSFSLNIGLRG